jgi:hypothetical protein
MLLVTTEGNQQGTITVNNEELRLLSAAANLLYWFMEESVNAKYLQGLLEEHGLTEERFWTVAEELIITLPYGGEAE